MDERVELLTIDKSWTAAYPDAAVGIMLVTGIANAGAQGTLAEGKAALEADIRARFTSRDAIKNDAVIQAYSAYYKRFKKSYHVFLQLDSIALKGKSIPNVNALVEAMFMAEISDLLLTAGHDWELVKPPVTLAVADVSEEYTVMSGKQQVLKAGDMYVRDSKGVLSSIVYGPDKRTSISADTRSAFFVTYAPPGITRAQTRAHLEHLRAIIRTFAPAAEADLRIYPDNI